MDIEKVAERAALEMVENGIIGHASHVMAATRAVLAIALAAAAETAKQAQFTDDPKHDHWAQACEEVSDRLRTFTAQLGTRTDG